MNPIDFNSGIKRLNIAFNNFYNKEREAALWQEFKSFTKETWIYLIDTAIRNLKTPPSVYELSGLVAEVREKAHEKMKYYYQSDAQAFWAGTYHDDEVKYIVRMIKSRLSHTVPDKDWDDFMKALKNNAVQSE